MMLRGNPAINLLITLVKGANSQWLIRDLIKFKGIVLQGLQRYFCKCTE